MSFAPVILTTLEPNTKGANSTIKRWWLLKCRKLGVVNPCNQTLTVQKMVKYTFVSFHIKVGLSKIEHFSIQAECDTGLVVVTTFYPSLHFSDIHGNRKFLLIQRPQKVLCHLLQWYLQYSNRILKVLTRQSSVDGYWNVENLVLLIL